MKKVDINEKSTKGKSVEFGEVKGHQSKLTWMHLIPTYCIGSKIAESLGKASIKIDTHAFNTNLPINKKN